MNLWPPTYNPQFTYDGKPYKYEKSHIGSTNYGNSSGTNGVIENDGRRYPKSIIRFKKDKQKTALHPTQKPLALIEYLILTYTKGGIPYLTTVWDPVPLVSLVWRQEEIL